MSAFKLDEEIWFQLAELAKSRTIRASAAVLVALGFLFRLNTALTRRKLNNYLTDKTWNWETEIVVVTGGSSGIGARIVARLAQKRIKVAILDLNEPSGKLAPNTYFYKTDISDPSAIISTAELIRSEHGDPTVLINNAGLGNAMPLLDLPETRVRKIFDVNIIAPILLVQQFLPSMVRRNHGHIVNIASMASFSTQASNVDYGCTKAGVLSLHEGLLQELRHLYKAPMVRASVVHPSWVRTPMVARLIEQGLLKDPTVSADDVANRVVDQLYSGYGAQMIVPESMRPVALLRGLPGWWQESMRDSVSINLLKAMAQM